jgi:hypothetical protein
MFFPSPKRQGCGKPRPHRDSIPNRPARSESLYRLRYPNSTDAFASNKMIRNTTVSLVMLLNYGSSTAKFTLNRTSLEPDPKCSVGMAVNEDDRCMFHATVLKTLREVKRYQWIWRQNMLHRPYRSGDRGFFTKCINTYWLTQLKLHPAGTEVISWTGGNPPYNLSDLLVI